MDFKFNLGDVVRDEITGFEGVVISRSQWLTNCNTYGVKSRQLHEGKPMESVFFDEPTLALVQPKIREAVRETGGPQRMVPQTNR